MAQTHGPEHSGEAITILKVDPREDRGLALRSAGQEEGGRLADVHSAYHDNISPPLEWDPVAEAQSYALIVEDPDAPRDKPFVHWMIWNIPGDARGLPQGIAPHPALTEPVGAIQGRNDAGRHGWFGPRPPVGHGVHRYYFQLFALDQPLEMSPETPLVELLNALKGHTIVKGEMMATYEAPEVQ
ncbi:MAG TPA: YbhB/YbcL family Raf kinase inhibitor-like protein [Phenylobacterium sp.]|nr:YbhB/YbcL family Raf kinase inhibitor-like protein [Phenylobacterium sp.]